MLIVQLEYFLKTVVPSRLCNTDAKKNIIIIVPSRYLDSESEIGLFLSFVIFEIWAFKVE